MPSLYSRVFAEAEKDSHAEGLHCLLAGGASAQIQEAFVQGRVPDRRTCFQASRENEALTALPVGGATTLTSSLALAIFSPSPIPSRRSSASHFNRISQIGRERPSSGWRNASHRIPKGWRDKSPAFQRRVVGIRPSPKGTAEAGARRIWTRSPEATGYRLLKSTTPVEERSNRNPAGMAESRVVEKTAIKSRELYCGLPGLTPC